MPGAFGTLFTEIFLIPTNPLSVSAESMQCPSFDQKVIVAADKSDTVNLKNSDDDEMACRAFILNAAATLHYLNASDVEITYAFAAGQYDIPIKRIFLSGTTLADNVMLVQF